tara:strand:+ start:2634 stop:3728 length:1095 start_codon:yes stop_codon:yes gene_type:complete
VLIFAERLDGKSGGPSVSIPEFSKSLDKLFLKNIVFCRSQYLSDNSSKNLSQLFAYKSQVGLILGIHRSLKQVSREKRVMHINFIWRLEIITIVLMGIFYKCNIVVNPRGMLNKKAFNSGSKLKDPFFRIVAKPLFLLGVNHFQCSSDEEKKTLKGYFPGKNVFLNILGYKRLPKAQKISLEDKFASKTIVSISRIDSHKRIDQLVKEFIDSRLAEMNWKLFIYGATLLRDYEAYVKDHTPEELQKNNISLNLFIDDTEKIEILSKATFFISTSNSESFGLAIAESFDVGTPVLIRNNTIWEDYIKNKCGISFDNQSIAYTLKTLLNLDLELYKEFARNIDRHYSPITWYDHTNTFLNKINLNK